MSLRNGADSLLAAIPDCKVWASKFPRAGLVLATSLAPRAFHGFNKHVHLTSASSPPAALAAAVRAHVPKYAPRAPRGRLACEAMRLLSGHVVEFVYF
jgi:hypothetical protein